MSHLTITCPHCGFSKSVERQRIPADAKTITCPKCKHLFAFDRGEKAAPKREAAPAPSRLSGDPPVESLPDQRVIVDERDARPSRGGRLLNRRGHGPLPLSTLCQC